MLATLLVYKQNIPRHPTRAHNVNSAYGAQHNAVKAQSVVIEFECLIGRIVKVWLSGCVTRSVILFVVLLLLTLFIAVSTGSC